METTMMTFAMAAMLLAGLVFSGLMARFEHIEVK